MNAAESAKDVGRVLPSSIWKRLGFAGLLFFLVKGLLWLSAPVVIYLLT